LGSDLSYVNEVQGHLSAQQNSSGPLCAVRRKRV
jgi:hypothetical protein